MTRLAVSVLLVALMAASVIALTSCGGGDDEDGKKQLPEPVKRQAAT